jgi:hypothetical protein
MTTHHARFARTLGLFSLVSIVGCAEPAASPPAASAPPPAVQTASAVPARPPGSTAAGVPPVPAPPASEGGPILGKKTDDVRDAQQEVAAGAQKVEPRITGKDPITVTGSAYAAIIGRTEQLRIKQAIDIFKATNDRFPRDYDEFKKEILDGNGIRLTRLPPHQKYGYDAEKHELVILEYPQ